MNISDEAREAANAEIANHIRRLTQSGVLYCGAVVQSLIDRVRKEDAETITKATLRGDCHAETLRGIAEMKPEEGSRMRQWARDGLSGYYETTEATVLRISNERNEIAAERDALRAIVVALKERASVAESQVENADVNLESVRLAIKSRYEPQIETLRAERDQAIRERDEARAELQRLDR